MPLIDEILTGFVQIWSLPAMTAALVGGVAGGYVLGVLFPRPAEQPSRPKQATIGLVIFLAIFWAGQLMDSLLSHDGQFGRALGRFAMQIVYAMLFLWVANWTYNRRADTPSSGER